jgi:acetyl-CoA carboxylase carboxyl transferase subunit beta
VGAVVVENHRLLLIERGSGASRGRWSIPGGHVELNETVHEAVVREVLEETGVEVVCGEFLDWAEVILDHAHYVILNFRADVLGNREPRAGSDEAAARWVPEWEVTELPLVDGLAGFLAEHNVIDLIS